MEESHSSGHVTEETAYLTVGVPVSPSKAHPEGPHLPKLHSEGFILLTHEFMGIISNPNHNSIPSFSEGLAYLLFLCHDQRNL